MMYRFLFLVIAFTALLVHGEPSSQAMENSLAANGHNILLSKWDNPARANEMGLKAYPLAKNHPGTIQLAKKGKGRGREDHDDLGEDEDHGHKKKHKKHGHKGEPEWARTCVLPPGLAKQNKVPPGWEKKCGHHRGVVEVPEVGVPGIHPPEVTVPVVTVPVVTAPCISSSGGERVKNTAIAGALGAAIGAAVGSATGETEKGAVFGGGVGALIGATAPTKDKKGGC